MQGKSLTLESHLSSFQDEDTVYQHLYDTWQIAKADLPKILRNIILSFPHYSRHDDSHSETILRRIEAILGEERIAKLHPTETWLILMSAYTHDIGMLVYHEDICNAWKSPEFMEYLEDILSDPSKEDLRKHAEFFIEGMTQESMPSDLPVRVKWEVIILTADYFRSKHPERSKQIIQNGDKKAFPINMDFSFNKFIPERLLELLGDIALLHGQPFDKIFGLHKMASGIGLPNDIIYPRRAAALLRLGDLLDMDNGRFDENAYCLYGEVPESTIYNREKHASLTHFLVTENRIEVAANCPTEGSFDAISRWMDWLETEIRDLSLRWNDIMPNDFGTAPTLIKPEIQLNGKFLKENSLRRFNFNNETIFELLEGANIYKDRLSCFRELIQNAVDASKIRFWHQIQSGAFDGEIKRKDGRENGKEYNELLPFDIPANEYTKFEIQVSIQYDPKRIGYNVSVEDHGIGISEERLEQMGQVAESWHSRKEQKDAMKEMPIWLRPTGEFGLGLQSVFQVTDELHCITYPENGTPKEIIFRSRANKGRISYQDCDSCSPWKTGTIFTFFISYDAFPLRWSLGDRVDVGINTSDPFLMEEKELKRYLKLFFLADRIKEDVGNQIFPVQVMAHIDGETYPEPHKKESYQKMQELKEAKRIGKGILVKFELENGKLLAYDPEHAIFFDLTLGFSASARYATSFTFKGMRVAFHYWKSIVRPYGASFHGNIEFSGFSAKEYLTLNRERFQEDKESEVYKWLDEDINLMLRFCYARMEDCKDENVIPAEEWLSFAGLYTFLLEKEPGLAKACEEKILRNINTDINAYQPDKEGSNTYRKETLPWKDCLRGIWNGEPFFVFDTQSMEVSMTEQRQTDAISRISERCNIRPETVHTRGAIGLLVNLQSFDLVNVYSDEEFQTCYIYECRLSGDPIRLPRIHGSLIRKMEKNLLAQQRMASMAYTTSTPEPCRCLALKNVPDLIWYSARRYFPCSSEFANIYCMITPFIEEDIDDISHGTSGEEAWKKIENREDFKKLVEHVQENSIEDNISEEDVRQAYRTWIKDIVAAVVT